MYVEVYPVVYILVEGLLTHYMILCTSSYYCMYGYTVLVRVVCMYLFVITQ